MRLYSDLSWLWPMWGDAEVEYAQYCAHVEDLIRRYARRPVVTLLDIGCGGGKNVFNLKERFRVTGLDLSPAMIAQARMLNPDCEFIEGDMRSFALGKTFDAVLIENSYDPDPSDDQFEATMLFLIRENGFLRVETDRYTLGLFSLETWRATLSETGFLAHEGTYADGQDEYTVFACLKPEG